jgi:hypothetical protein
MFVARGKLMLFADADIVESGIKHHKPNKLKKINQVKWQSNCQIEYILCTCAIESFSK